MFFCRSVLLLWLPTPPHLSCDLPKFFSRKMTKLPEENDEVAIISKWHVSRPFWKLPCHGLNSYCDGLKIPLKRFLYKERSLDHGGLGERVKWDKGQGYAGMV